jgi:hypothetical protein
VEERQMKRAQQVALYRWNGEHSKLLVGGFISFDVTTVVFYLNVPVSTI